jgi:hypothetical protein
VEFDQVRKKSDSVREDRKSENDTEIERQEDEKDHLLGIAGIEAINRMSTGRDLSALTNQILELIIDNVKMVHVNKKLVDYFKM